MMRAAGFKILRGLRDKRIVKTLKAALLIGFLVAASLLAYYLATS